MIVMKLATPASLGFHMPAEWEEHEATLLAWPHDPLTFPDRIGKAEEAYVSIIKAIALSEKVYLLVLDERMQQRVSAMLLDAGVDLSVVRFFAVPYADVWFRDYGPTFVVDRNARKRAMVDWIFSAWGDKYEELKKDSAIPSFLNGFFRVKRFEPGIVMEGGSIDVNGRGMLLTTEQCLLNRNRNPSLSRKQIEEHLKAYLGVSCIVWLKEGIAGDDTDGHVDDVARFVSPHAVLCAYADSRNDPDFPALGENFSILSEAKDNDGSPLAVLKLPVPARKVVDDEGKPLPASYANFYIGNTVVLVPQFNDTNDEKAIAVLSGLFPHRKVVGIDCSSLVFGLGTLHCVSQQVPKV